MLPAAARCAGSARLEVERAGVDAVAQPARIARAVVEHVPEVAAAALADDLRAAPAVGGVLAGLDRVGELRLREARPARAGLELRPGVEELGAAARAAIDAVVVAVPVAARDRPPRPAAPQQVVRPGPELVTPLRIGLRDLGGHGSRVDA